MSIAAVLSPIASKMTRSLVIAPEVSVSDESGWRILLSTRAECDPSWRMMLTANSTLPPRLKYALVPESWRVELRADCLDSEIVLARSCERFMRRTVPVSDGAHPAETDAETWIELCESAGWKAEKRANNTVVIPLSSGRHIRIEASDGAVRGVVELGEIAAHDSLDVGVPASAGQENVRIKDGATFSEFVRFPDRLKAGLQQDAPLNVGVPASASIRARELLLLTLAHEMRMIRPMLRGRAAGTHTLAEIEVGFPHKPEAEQWQHALSALAVAAAACADVFEALGDEDLASRYLAIREPRKRPPV